MAYQRIGWENSPSTSTPLDADNLNHMEDGIVTNEQAIEGVSEAVEEVSETVDDLSEIVEGKQDTLTFDDAPTKNSDNPVKSNGIYDAILNVLPTDSASGNPCVITDAFGSLAKSLKLTMNPIQDLHGYSKPWVGGSGKNKLFLTDETVTKSGVTITPIKDAAGNLIGYDIDGTATANVDHWFATGLGLEAGTNRYITTGLSTEKVGFQLVIAPSYTGVKTNTTLSLSINGVYINITSGTSFSHLKIQPMICLASESDKSFAPYENICPISGRSSATLDRTGKNLLDPTLNTGSQVGVTFTNDNGVLTLNGTATQTTNLPIKMRIDTGATFWLPAGEYVFSAEGLEKGVHVGTTYNGAYVQIAANINGNSVSFTINENTASDYKDGSKILVGLYIGIESGKTYANQKIYPMVRPSIITDATYEPYNGESITRTYGQTIYDGSDDVTGDGATVTRYAVDLGSLSWAAYNTAITGKDRFRAVIPNAKQADTSMPTSICSNYALLADGGTWPGTNTGYTITINSELLIYDENCASMSADEFKTAMSGVILVYELINPSSIPLTPQNITLLQGNNVLTTDADSIEASYSADIALYIQKSTSESSSNRSVDTSSLTKSGSSESTEEITEEVKEITEEK